MPKLTQAEIRDLLAEYEHEVFARMHADMADDEQAIYDSEGWWTDKVKPTWLKGFPTTFKAKILPYAKKGVEIATNHTLVGEVPEVRYSLRQGVEATDALERRRKITEDLAKAILRNIADRTTINPFKELLEKQHGLGGGALTFPFRWDEWKRLERLQEDDPEEYERQIRDAWFWDVHVTHPKLLFFDVEHDPPAWYILKDEITHRAAGQLYPEQKAQMAMDKGKVERIAYVSIEQYFVQLGGQVVVDGDNPCGMLWYEWCWGGYGSLDAERHFEHLGKGLIRDARDALALIMANINVAEAKRITAAFAPPIIKGKTKKIADGYADALEFGPDKVFTMGEDGSVEPFPQAEMQTTVQWSQEEAKGVLELVFGQTILSGFFPEKTASGQRQRVNLAETPFLPAKIASEQACGNMLRKMLRFLKYELGATKYRISMGRYGPLMDVDPEDILEDGVLEINYTPITAEDRAFNKENDARDLERFIIGKPEYRRRQGIEDGDKQDKDIAKQTVIDALAEVAIMVARERMMAQFGVGAQPGTIGQPGAPSAGPMEPMSGNENELTAPEATAADARRMFSVPAGVR